MKKGWKVPVGEIFDVTMMVDTNVADAHEFVADAFTVKSIVGGLRIDIDTELDSVTSQLAGGSTVHFFFPDSSEPEWTGSLRGSSAAIKSWMTCVNKSKAVAPPKVDLSKRTAPDWDAIAADRIVGEAVAHVATTGGKLSPDAVAIEAKRRAAAEDVKLGEVDYDARIAHYLIAKNARKLKCANDGLAGSDAIEKLTGAPKQQLAAEGVTLKVDWDKLGLDELERYRKSAGGGSHVNARPGRCCLPDQRSLAPPRRQDAL